jgi:Ran GTPase-activating protein (RanGAP) involved in mRNA processing and transport
VENLVVTYEQDTDYITYIDSDDGTDDGTQYSTYSGDSIFSDKKHIHVESTYRNINNHSKLEAEEHGSVLLEVKVEGCPDHIECMWHLYGTSIEEPSESSHGHTGKDTPVLCISDASIEMDGWEYSCELKGFYTTESVTLRVNCPLDEYTPSLASMYLAQSEVPRDTWPPVSNTKHVNLALIRQGYINYRAQYERLTIRGDIDDILHNKRRIEYAELVKDIKGKYCLFIEGRPGSGKTTFVHKITRDWAIAPSGALRLVLLVSLRVLNALNKPSLDLSDILDLFKDLKVGKELLEERDGKGVCFIFDGLDEFSPRDKRDSVVHQIIRKEYLSQSSVIVASRPAAIAELRGSANKVIEVLGFPNEQIFEYFDSYNFSDRSKSKSLKKYLRHHPNILHMCYLPVHTAMVAFLFEATGKVPRTETEIYKQFTCFTIIRSLTKNTAVSTADIDICNLSEDKQVLFDQICKLALEKIIANKQVLHQDEVSSYFQNIEGCDISLGLITIDRIAGLYGMNDVYAFLHLTFQEYLAAYHISTLNSEKQVELLELHGGKNWMLVVWKFLCGLVKFDVSDHRFITLAKKIVNSLFLVQCTYESQQAVVCEILLEQVRATLTFEQKHLTTPDFTALGYVLAKTSTPLSLSFKYCDIDIEAVNAMLSEIDKDSLYIYALQYYSGKVDCKCLCKMLHRSGSLSSLEIFSRDVKIELRSDSFKYCTNLTTLCANNVLLGLNNLQTVASQCKGLQELVLNDSILVSELCLLNKIIEKCKMLKVLNISNNRLGKAAESLSPGLALSQNLESFIVSRNSIDSAGVTVLLESVKACKLKVFSNELLEGNHATMFSLIGGLTDCDKLQELHLLSHIPTEACEVFAAAASSRNWCNLYHLELNSCIDDTTAGYISYALPFLADLKVLRVLGSPMYSLSDLGTADLAGGLSKCTNLTDFLIRHCKFGDEGTKRLVSGLEQCRGIRTLDMSCNCIGDGGAACVFAKTGHMTGLIALNLSGNFISEPGVMPLPNGLAACTALSTLDLNENFIGVVGAKIISSCLQYWPNLQTLELSGRHGDSNIGKEGVVALAYKLPNCTQLSVLNLSDNDIDEYAASILVENLAKCKKIKRLYLENNGTSEHSPSIRELQRWEHLELTC